MRRLPNWAAYASTQIKITMKKTKKILLGFILLWVVGFLVVWGVTFIKKTPIGKFKLPAIGREKQAETPEGAPEGMPGQASEAVSVRTFRAALTDFKDELPVMGTVRGSLEIDLKFEINGTIEAINFREGDIIYRDDLIATLGKKDADLKVEYAKSKIEIAKVQLKAAEKKLEVISNLYEIGGIIKAKLEEVELEVEGARLQVESAKVELESAKLELNKTNLSAPRDGVLGSRDAEVGEFVTGQDKIAVLYDTMKVFLELGIVEKDINKIALGLETTVTVDAYPGMIFTGTTDYVYPVIEGKSRTLTVKVGIENEDAMLLPGMFARAMITVAEFYDALVIPSMSLSKTDEGVYKVFVADESNQVSSRDVQVAYITTDYAVIESGLYENELVVTDTPQELKDGMSVNIIEVQEGMLEEE